MDTGENDTLRPSVHFSEFLPDMETANKLSIFSWYRRVLKISLLYGEKGLQKLIVANIDSTLIPCKYHSSADKFVELPNLIYSVSYSFKAVRIQIKWEYERNSEPSVRSETWNFGE